MLDFISEKILREYADEGSYERGEKYFKNGQVEQISVKNDRIIATVTGTELYDVELWEEAGSLEYSCACPWYEDTGDFCKHCVAVGLQYLHKPPTATAAAKKKKGASSQKEITMKDVRKYLESLSEKELTDLLMGQVEADEEFGMRMKMRIAKENKNVNLALYRRAIDRALDFDDDDWNYSGYEYSSRVEKIIKSHRDLLKDGFAPEVIELTEYCLAQLDEALQSIDDSDGYLGNFLEDVQDLHHAACLAAKPDPEALARRLYEIETTSEFDVFSGAAQRYAEVLGERGFAMYRKLADAAWAKLPARGPNSRDGSYTGNRYRIAAVMESLARLTNDVEQVVAVLSKDLSSEYSYLKIAEEYQKARKRNKAREWAEKGVQAFPDRTDSRLREFLAASYCTDKRYDEAMDLIWKIFVESTSLQHYSMLKDYAGRADEKNAWPIWRERALQKIREEIAVKKHETANKMWAMYKPDSSLLVEIFLWEKDSEAAWREAQDGGCNQRLRITLAGLREKEHPADSLAVYLTLVEPLVRQTNNDAYREAVKFIKKIWTLNLRLNKTDEWQRYLAQLKTTHKRKRNFIALLEKIDPLNH
jgi:uncharacterized Zn finger protein